MVEETKSIREALREFNEQVEANLSAYEKELTSSTKLSDWEWCECGPPERTELCRIASENGLRVPNPFSLNDDEMGGVYYRASDNHICLYATGITHDRKGTEFTVFRHRLRNTKAPLDIDSVALQAAKEGVLADADEMRNRILAAKRALINEIQKGHL